jgi:hypothetical protein
LALAADRVDFSFCTDSSFVLADVVRAAALRTAGLAAAFPAPEAVVFFFDLPVEFPVVLAILLSNQEGIESGRADYATPMAGP